MRWDERQTAMLRAMGVRLWAPERPAVGAADETAGTDGTLAETAPSTNRATTMAATATAIPTSRPTSRPTSIPTSIPTSTPTPPACFAAAVGRAAPPDAATTAAGRSVDAGPPPLARLAMLDWPALRDAAAGCTACALCEGRTRSVFGGGSAAADWLIVGEPPVEAEDREGTPFAGRPGQLLDSMLRAVGVGRAIELGVPAGRACVTVPVKCRPPGNRLPTPDEVDVCGSYLARQIAIVRPKVVVAMGRTAALLLRSDDPLGRLRGRVHRYRGLPLVATYAPSYLLRHPGDKARAWDDLCLALEVVAKG